MYQLHIRGIQERKPFIVRASHICTFFYRDSDPSRKSHNKIPLLCLLLFDMSTYVLFLDCS